jgi:hypothetical protein
MIQLEPLSSVTYRNYRDERWATPPGYRTMQTCPGAYELLRGYRLGDRLLWETIASGSWFDLGDEMKRIYDAMEAA